MIIKLRSTRNWLPGAEETRWMKMKKRRNGSKRSLEFAVAESIFNEVSASDVY